MTNFLAKTLKNVVKLSNDGEDCGRNDCPGMGFPHAIAHTDGYVVACRSHVQDMLKDEIIEGNIKLSAAACPRCAGWTSFGGMSSVKDNQCDCVGGNLSPVLKFDTSPAHAGYGARVWVNKDDIYALPTLHGVLDGLSKWGGSDKTSEDGMIAWEFNERSFEEAVRACKAVTKLNEVEA